MPFYIDTSGIDVLRARILAAQTVLATAPRFAVTNTCNAVAQTLAVDAPRSDNEEGEPAPGDAPGHLADSFLADTVDAGELGAFGSVSTTQPTKLRWVTEGTGIYGPTGQRIYPRTKRALFWPDAAHPYRSVRGMPPRPFVAPVLALAGDIARAQLAEAAQSVVAALSSE